MSARLAFMLAALLAASASATPAVAAAPAPAASPQDGKPAAPADGALSGFLDRARAWLLSGEGPPRDLRLRLQALGPGDRLTAIAWLRRAGLVEGPAFAPDFILAPAADRGE